MGVRPRASAAAPYTNTRRGTGILPVMFMARMAMPRLCLRLRRAAPPAGLTLQKCHAMAQLHGGFDEVGAVREPPLRNPSRSRHFTESLKPCPSG